MKKQFIFLLTFAHLTFSFAQNTNTAYFKITPKDHLTEIEADFSSIIQKTLLVYKPSLEFSKNKIDFKNEFLSYLKTADKELHFTTTPHQIQNKIPTKFNIFNYKYLVLVILFLIFLIIITIQEYKT